MSLSLSESRVTFGPARTGGMFENVGESELRGLRHSEGTTETVGTL